MTTLFLSKTCKTIANKLGKDIKYRIRWITFGLSEIGFGLYYTVGRYHRREYVCLLFSDLYLVR